MCKTPNIRPIKQSPTNRNFTKSKGLSPHLQKYEYYVPAKLTTLDMLVPYSKYLNNVPPTSSSKQIEERLHSLALPTKPQTNTKSHSIKHEQTYSGAKDGPHFLHHIDANNTN